MHFEILVEDASGKIILDSVLKKILSLNIHKHSYTIHGYKGIGRIPKNLKRLSDPQKRILMNQLPGILRGYGRSLQHFQATVVVVVDLDDRNCIEFKNEMTHIVNSCFPKPETIFRIAIEEIEAWLLGDIQAIKTAYPSAKDNILERYHQDSICGTWEILADAIYHGGSKSLKQSGWPHIGIAKCEWARNISPHMDVDSNQSKSFQVFRDSIRNRLKI